MNVISWGGILTIESDCELSQWKSNKNKVDDWRSNQSSCLGPTIIFPFTLRDFDKGFPTWDSGKGPLWNSFYTTHVL